MATDIVHTLEGTIVDTELCQPFTKLAVKTVDLSLLETVENGPISNKPNLDRKQQTPADIRFIYSQSVLPVTSLSTTLALNELFPF